MITTPSQIISSQAGILLIDKPAGITSHDVVDRVRRIVGVKRVGHAGTLDPFATGLLIVLVSREFTKQQVKFLKLNKEYLCQAQLGVTSDTYDITGQVTETADWSKLSQVTEAKLKQALASFTGQITQVVPAYSAVRVKGHKLYELARRHQLNQVELPAKQVEIFRLELLDFKLSAESEHAEFTVLVNCSSGTYIRSLIHDLGQQLGLGAVTTTLKRTQIGPYQLTDAIGLEQLQRLAEDFS